MKNKNIEYLIREIKNTELQQNAIANDYNLYKIELNSKVRAIMREAGILEEVKSIEEKIEKKRVKDQEAIDKLSQKNYVLQKALEVENKRVKDYDSDEGRLNKRLNKTL